MKKKIGILLLSCSIMFSLAACGQMGDGTQNGRSTLTFMVRSTDFDGVYMQRIMELYEKEGKSRIELIVIDNSKFNEKVQEAFDKGEEPDLLFDFNSSFLEHLGIEEHFYYLDDQEWVPDLTDSARVSCQDSEGHILGLPFWENSVSGCYYNKTILDSLGLRPASTQQEFDTLCQTLVDLGKTPLCWSFKSCSWIYQFGLDPIFADDPALLDALNAGETDYADIPAVRDMVTWVYDASQKGWFGRDYADRDWNGISKAMGTGECVMINIWDTWFYNSLSEDGTYTKDDFALMPVFLNTESAGTYEGGNLNMIMVNKNSRHLEEALDFLRFCATPENYNAAFDGVPTVSCFKGQTTNIQTDMVIEAMASINLHMRPSTAWFKIDGYSQEEMSAAFRALITGGTDVDGCIGMMDASRLKKKK